MPKQKPHKGTVKRVKKTGRGKLMREHAAANHFLRKKNGSQKRDRRKKHQIKKSQRDSIQKSLGDK